MQGDFDSPVDIEWSPGKEHGQVRFGNDKFNMAVFYTRSVPNAIKSETAGRQICENKAYVRIQAPGERLMVVDRPVQDADKRKWPNEWKAYVTNKTQIPDGTPIDLLFPNHPNIPDMLKGSGIYTVEQMAEVSANALDTIGMGAQDWKNKAQAYLDSTTNGKAFRDLNNRVEKAEQNNRIMQHQLSLALAKLKDYEDQKLNPQKYNINNPQNISGVDIQAERINGLHTSKELAKQLPQDNPEPSDPMDIDLGDKF